MSHSHMSELSIAQFFGMKLLSDRKDPNILLTLYLISLAAFISLVILRYSRQQLVTELEEGETEEGEQEQQQQQQALVVVEAGCQK